MARRRGEPPSAARAARGSRSDHATASGAAAAKGGPSARGGGGARGRGRREGRGRGRRDATPTPRPSPRLAPAETHVERTPLEFLLKLQGCIRTRLQLPSAFAKAMGEEKLPMLWLWVHGCGNGVVPMAWSNRVLGSCSLAVGGRALLAPIISGMGTFFASR